jgi:hypothetical protein
MLPLTEHQRLLKALKTLAARYEAADAYNRPAIEFELRRQFGLYLSEPPR